MSRRIEQVESTLQRAIQQAIARGLHDPRAGGLITVTGVKVTPDLKSAFIMVSVLPDEKQELTLHALRHAARHLRRRVGDIIDMADLPEFVFRADSTTKQQGRLLDAFSKIQQEREAAEGAPQPREEQP